MYPSSKSAKGCGLGQPMLGLYIFVFLSERNISWLFFDKILEKYWIISHVPALAFEHHNPDIQIKVWFNRFAFRCKQNVSVVR